MREARLGDVVASMKNGIYKPASEYADDGTPCLRMYNIDAGSIVWRDIKRMRISAKEFSEYELREGDLLVNRVNSRELVGKAAYVPAFLEPSVFESKNIRVRLDTSKVLPKFINYQLVARGSRHFANNAQQVVGMASISQGQLANFPIALTAIDEQRRVVAEIEKQFSRLDEAVANLQRVKANVKRYEIAVFKAAVEGRLVETEASLARREGRSYETGEQLFCRILETRRGLLSEQRRHPEISEPGRNLPQLPPGWAWVPIAYVGADPRNTVQTGPFGAQLHNTEFTEYGVPVIAVGNLTGTGFSAKGIYFISEEKAQQLRRYDVRAGDLLFARSGATLGKVCVAPPEVKDWRMTGHILRARLNKSFIKPDLAVYALAALPAVRKQVFQNVRGVTRPGFNTALLESILIPVPPYREQVRIVSEVDRSLSLLCEVAAEVEANLKRAHALRQSILAKAFSGAHA
jgi:type I restriction enzyme, S subunit